MNLRTKLIGLTAALTTAIALPALAAYSLTGQPLSTAIADTGQDGGDTVYTLIDDDGDHGSARRGQKHGGDDDDDDDGFSPSMTAPPVSAEPPSNGLFNNGSTKPQAQIH